ncbi:uncharacterized protein MELLADRAFT_65902 [Melampsora larici-populina 98AG31]|uniref:Uncharacterized protein n=1 Tax=Melampsora larici-populina (strain 98AG31 / pathotype 3-4-7) TaxID=747676 RepID=F4RX55_MELLP|nr:uncharacterized protein MELLADRAFT_65902 [Melampsora larici-populina 98AG31]EGG03044.1 hypothetical protein MELLADRAFT_65902 [Melampsora larici-populina 98AG31]
MSASLISDVTATLSSITPVSTNEAISQQTEAPAETSESNTTQHSSGEGRPSGSQGTPNQGAFGRYNKQMLISNYLNRGKGPVHTSQTSSDANGNKETVDDTNPSAGQNGLDTLDLNAGYKQVPATKEAASNSQQLEAEFRNMFGTSEKLPKIQKKTPATTKSQTMEESEFTKAVNLLNDIRNGKQPSSRIKEIIDLTDREDTPVPLINKTSSFTKSFNLPEASFSEGGLQFDFSITPDANAQSLPLFFQKNMQLLQGQLPLTIFNRAWQQTASDNHVDYKKTEKEVEKYRGHPFPGEWTQSRFEWGENMENFITMLRDDYKFCGFADAMEVHRKNVIKIFKQQRSWVIAFKYDLTIRKVVFAVRNPDQKVPNPALEPEGLVNEIFYNARAQDDLNTEDNPYRKGGPKAGKNPYSDILTEFPTTSPSQTRNFTGPSRNYFDRKDKPQFKSSGPYGNYKGRNFDPNHRKVAEVQKGKGKEKEM